MKFYISALDSSGIVTLERDSVPSAIKKADELISDGFLNVEIIMPDGAAYRPNEFEQLRERVALAAKSSFNFDVDQAMSDDKRALWTYTLLDAQGATAVVRPEDRTPDQASFDLPPLRAVA